MSEKKVSVLMPVKKADEFFWIALDSIIKQTYKNIEILIIVDKDYVKKIRCLLKIKNIDDLKIKIIGSSIAGIASALNLGIQESSGEFIARMDSDDIADQNRFEKQLIFLNKNIKCQILGTRATYINELGQKIGISEKINKNFQKNLYFRNLIIHPTVMMRANFLKEIGGYSNAASEDYELWLRCLAKERESICILNEELLAYRKHDSQLSKITRIKSQAAVCSAVFGLLCRDFNITLMMALIYNLVKLWVRKIIALIDLIK
jgi:glycosyltransferase involved in cell wall biosynthesis